MIRPERLQDWPRFALLVLLMVGTVSLVSGLTFLMLYRTAFKQMADRLEDAVKSQAALIEAMSDLEQRSGGGNPPRHLPGSILARLREAEREIMNLGRTGEFELARMEGEEMVFVLPHRHGNFPDRHRLPLDSRRATAMAQALRGNGGVILAQDYRGVEVLAAYRPVRSMEMGLVAKMDLSEIRAPFVRTAVLVVLAGLGAALVATALFLWLTRPMLRKVLESEAHLRGIVETAVDGILTIDERGSIQSANPAAERLFGYAAPEMVGRNVNLLMPSPDRERHDGYMQNYLATGHRKIIGIGRELTGLRRDGSTFPLLLGVGEVRVNDRRMFTGIIHDLSARKEMEARMRAAHSLTTLGMIARGIAHQFNNRFQVIRSYVEIVEAQAPAREKLQRAISQIQGNLSRCHDLTRHLLAFSGGRETRPVRLDLAALLNDLAALLEPLLPRRMVLKVITNGEPLTALADPKALRNALLQICLFANAAMDGAGELTLALAGPGRPRRTPAGNGNAEITVHGTGISLTPEERAGLFTCGDASGRAHEHERLGLIIAEGIVRAMKGEISVESGAGEGATFVVALPRPEPA